MNQGRNVVILVGIVEFQHIAVIGNGVLVALGALADQTLIVQFMDVVGIECDVTDEKSTGVAKVTSNEASGAITSVKSCVTLISSSSNA